MENRYRDLENRTTLFAQNIVKLCMRLDQRDAILKPLISQVIRSSGSVRANYREANEKLSRKDCLYRLKIARKEAKETDHWLRIILVRVPELIDDVKILEDECDQLRRILSSIIPTVEGRPPK